MWSPLPLPRRSRHAHSVRRARDRCSLQLEALEARTVLAAGPAAVFVPASGTLLITGTNQAEEFKLQADEAGQLEVLYQGAPLTITNRGGADCAAGGSCPTVEKVLAVDVAMRGGEDLFVFCRDERMRLTLETDGGKGADTLRVVGNADDERLQVESTLSGRSQGYRWSLSGKPLIIVAEDVEGEAVSVERFEGLTGGGNDTASLVYVALDTRLQASSHLDLGEGQDLAQIELNNSVSCGGGPAIICIVPPLVVQAGPGQDIITAVATGSGEAASVLEVYGEEGADIIAVHTDQGAALDYTVDGGNLDAVDMLIRSGPDVGLGAAAGTNFELVLEVSSSAPVVFVDSSSPVVFVNSSAPVIFLTRVSTSSPVVFLVSSFTMRMELSETTWLTDFAFFLEDPLSELSSTMTLPLDEALFFLWTEDPIIVGPPL